MKPTVSEAVAQLYAGLDAECARLNEWEARKKPRKRRMGALIKQVERIGKRVSSVAMPDGTVLHFGEPQPTEASNPWLDDLKVTKR